MRSGRPLTVLRAGLWTQPAMARSAHGCRARARCVPGRRARAPQAARAGDRRSAAHGRGRASAGGRVAAI